jgi:hypothetical protein
MNATEITAWGGLVVAVIAGIIIPWIFRRKNQMQKDIEDRRLEEEKRRLEEEKSGSTAVLNWTNFTTALQAERNDLRKQLDEIEGRHRQQLKDVEETWEARNTLLRARVTELETDVATLERRLTIALRSQDK